MVSSQTELDLYSDTNEILLNPRWPKEDYESLRSLALGAQEQMKLKGHVWIATSGSTANSYAGTKLVALSKSALKASAQAVNEHLQSNAQDVWTQVLPHFHVGGLGIEVRASLSKARVVPALKNQKWDALYFYEILKSEKCTLSALVPTQVYDLVTLGLRAPPSLRAVVVGGGAFEEELYHKARSLGWPVLPSYGMTETASQIATAPLDSLKEFSYPAISLLSHAQARTSPEGFLQVRATSLLTCYAQNTEAGAKIWDPKIEGWFTTEDQGEVVSGSLSVKGRSQDYVKIGGEATNVARLRSLLEKCILSYDSSYIKDLVLLDMPSDRLGKEMHLVSTLPQEITEKVVQLFAEKVLPFEKIRKIHYIPEIPRSDLGKVLWVELRKKL